MRLALLTFCLCAACAWASPAQPRLVERLRAVVERWETQVYVTGWQCSQAKRRIAQLLNDGNPRGAERMTTYYRKRLREYMVLAKRLTRAQQRLAAVEGRA